MRTPGSDGYSLRGNTCHSKLNRDQVEDIREEWSRKRELRRVASELEDEIDALKEEIKAKRQQVAEALAAQAKITHTGLAKQHDVSIHTIQSVISEQSWPEY